VDDATAKGRVTLFRSYAQRYTKPAVPAASAAYAKLAREHELTPTQLALSFVMHAGVWPLPLLALPAWRNYKKILVHIK